MITYIKNVLDIFKKEKKSKEVIDNILALDALDENLIYNKAILVFQLETIKKDVNGFMIYTDVIDKKIEWIIINLTSQKKMIFHNNMDIEEFTEFIELKDINFISYNLILVPSTDIIEKSFTINISNTELNIPDYSFQIFTLIYNIGQLLEYYVDNSTNLIHLSNMYKDYKNRHAN